jgi:gamma-glutamyl-gamma-aminobutyrate hydrolase PuuD
MSKVLILPGDSYSSAVKMFERHGWDCVSSNEDFDLICFLGGTDVDPAVYGAERHPMTQTPDTLRDKTEVSWFNEYPTSKAKVGICRGGQLLNVLNGGGMIQHLGETRSGVVKAQKYDDIGSNKYIDVLVDHHQGMINYDTDWCGYQLLRAANHHGDTVVSYACYHPETKSLCFQPHPEWGHKGTEDYFFQLLEEHLALSSTHG